MNDFCIQMLSGLSVTFHGMTLKDLVIFSHVCKQEGITVRELAEKTGYSEKELQASTRKLTGSKLATQQTRYLLIKEQQEIKGISFYLTTKGTEYGKLLKLPS